eukprot:3533381-Rhodomonas_salina.1
MLTFAGTGSSPVAAVGEDATFAGDGDAKAGTVAGEIRPVAAFATPRVLAFTPDGSRLLVLEVGSRRLRTIASPSSILPSGSLGLQVTGDSHGLFCDALGSSFANTGQWLGSLGVLELYICPGADMLAGSTYSLSFNLTNPLFTSAAPEIPIRAQGTAQFKQSAMAKPGVLQSRYGIPNGADPLYVVIPEFLDRTIGQST